MFETHFVGLMKRSIDLSDPFLPGNCESSSPLSVNSFRAKKHLYIYIYIAMAGLFSAVSRSRPARTMSKTVIVLTGVGSFLYTFHVLYRFMCFASGHNDYQRSMIHYEITHGVVLSAMYMLLVDACLLSLFMLQHSFMASDVVKNVYSKLNLEDVERSVYNAASAGVLHFLTSNWRPVPSYSLWDVETSESNGLWLLFTSFHVLGWFIVYSGCIMMDISELAGLKQVYYKLSARPCPLSIKSRELQRYYAHMRHPSFTGFLMILWIHPFMTLDRLLLSSILTVYMIMMWTIDHEDYLYHATSVQLKRRHLS